MLSFALQHQKELQGVGTVPPEWSIIVQVVKKLAVFLQNQEVHWCVHYSPSLEHILTHMTPIRTFPSCLLRHLFILSSLLCLNLPRHCYSASLAPQTTFKGSLILRLQIRNRPKLKKTLMSVKNNFSCSNNSKTGRKRKYWNFLFCLGTTHGHRSETLVSALFLHVFLQKICM